MNKHSYEIILGSPIDFEHLVVEVFIDGKYYARLDREKGIDEVRIEFFEPSLSIPIYVDQLLEILTKAKIELLRE